jgi:preprotein translocase subunit SecG
MLITLLVLQTIISVAMIGVILLQRNAGDGLSGLGGGSNNALLSGRSSANIMTRTTSVLAILFMTNCLLMATLAARKANITYKFAPRTTQTLPKPAPATSPDNTNNSAPVEESTPAAPLAE